MSALDNFLDFCETKFGSFTPFVFILIGSVVFGAVWAYFLPAAWWIGFFLMFIPMTTYGLYVGKMA